MVSHEDMKRAQKRGADLLREGPVASFARYDLARGKVVVDLRSGLEIAFAPQDAQGLENATLAELETVEITSSGLGLYFPALDVDLYVPGLLQGIFGSKSWTAARSGAKGGASKSTVKAAAARANGASGGRPRKVSS
jgi:hypothetical protein